MSHFSTTQNYVCSHSDFIGYGRLPSRALLVGSIGVAGGAASR